MSSLSAYFSTILILLCLKSSDVGASPRVETSCQNGKGKVFVVDNLLKKNEIQMLNDYLIHHRPWILNQKDVFRDSFIDVRCNTTWVSPLSVETVQRTRLWREISVILKQLTGSTQYLCNAMFTIVNRMDFNPISKADGSLMMQIFLNDNMRKNDYGEMVFYDYHDDVMCGVRPIPGRILLWNSSISYIPKPPSMDHEQSLNSMVLQLTDSKVHYEECMELTKANEQALLTFKDQNFPFKSGDTTKLESIHKGAINFENYLTKKFFDSKGREIAIFDNVLSENDLHELREYLINDYHTFGFQPYDNDPREDHDNVAWMSTQKADVLVKSGLWQVVKEAAKYLSGLDQWYPYDVSMNIIRAFHHTRIHEDCEPDEYEYTFLLYLNPEWNENLYGETVFFDQVNEGEGKEVGGEQYEIVAAVRPYYGRIVMFRGIIPHSARPPSPGFQGARYTFACKVSQTYRSAKSKKLRETVEALHGMGVEDNEIELSKELESQGKQPDEIINLALIKQQQRREEFIKKNQEYTLTKL